MSKFHGSNKTPINLFDVYDRYLFKHYFNDNEIFSNLKYYYNEDKYRFEVPKDSINEVKQLLKRNMFEPIIIKEFNEFGVVKEKYTDHPKMLFRESLLQESTSNYNIFVMKDKKSVEKAVMNGANKLSNTDIEIKFVNNN